MLLKTIEKARHKFDNKFTYIIGNAKRVIDKITITCPIHGEFIQEARVHLKSTEGCPKCSREKSNIKQRKSQEDFIQEAKITHNNKYSYDKTVYINDLTKVIITCPIHGDFKQQAGSHIGKASCGCKKCAIQEQSDNQRLPKSEFVNRLQLPEHITVDFNTYVSCKTKVNCTCAYHGDFVQLPEILYSGKGICPTCAKQLRGWNRSLYKESPTTVYVLELINGTYKIGITKACNVYTRYTKQDRPYIKQIAFQVTMLNGLDAWDIEKQVLKKLASFKYKGPRIFIDTGVSEILTIDPTPTLKRLLHEQLFYV